MMMSKAEIRAEALQRRQAVPEETRQAFAARLATVGPALVRSAEDPLSDPVVSLFRSIKGEPDTAPLIAVLNTIGMTTALPVTGARGTPLVFRQWAPGNPLQRGPWGIEEPSGTAPIVVPNVLFVPLAAFDRRGARVGYGGGYYDATLASLRRTKTIRAIGVAFACQEMLYVPMDERDEPLDVVVTERDVILCEP
jgi:5-formyltetrahydrofolate cyclo-ligase